jgi:uncharacterized membrane protein
MAEKLAKWLIGVLAFIKNRYVITFIISMMPILELRGGLIAASLLGLKPIPSIIICYLGNLLPIPFILAFIMPLFDWLKKRKFMSKVVEWCLKKADKRKDSIERLQYIGLAIFVAIPLPVTGAWTGALIASVLDMDKKKAFLSIALGLVLASIIMYIISFGIIGGLVK